MDVTELLDQLNDAQREAVCAPSCNQLILAGAGSGKTRVLVHRIAWLMQVEHVAPYQIMAVTFTNKAAREMRERLTRLVGENYGANFGRGLWVGTFHGIAHRLLKSHWQEAGLLQNFQILDSEDQLRVIKRVYQELQLDDKKWPHRQAQYFINEQKDEGKRAQHLADSHDLYLATMKRVYVAYEQACERGGLVDFAELLLRSHELWLKKPDLLEHYQRRFNYILVDEFQDTNAVQYAWLRVLAGQSSYVTAVGDDDQSIYGWRGARIENIHHFSHDFSDTTTTRLEQNYRSTGTILAAANAVIANNTGRLGKKLWTSGKDGELIDLYTAFNEQDEARHIVDRIKTWVERGGNLKNTAILYRSNAQSRVLEEALFRENIAYRIYGGLRFYERLEIKNTLAYLRLIQNRNDDSGFERVVNTPTRGIGAKTTEALREIARDQGCSLYQASLHIIANKGLTVRATGALNGFLNLIDELDKEAEELSLGDLVDLVVKKSGLYEFHQNEKGERGQARVENLQELVNACRQYEHEDEELSPLEEFLDAAALDAGERQADEYEDAVQMMTLHSAKGLEFPLVFLAGVEENLFPHRMSADDPEKLEEERRLCYVGITRAMEKLILTHAESRRLYGEEKYNGISRFVREIPKDLVQEVRIKSSIARPTQFSNKNNFAFNENADEDFGELQLGQFVAHNKFGEGVILQFEGRGSSARVQVKFNSGGTKWLVLQYAKLQVLC